MKTGPIKAASDHPSLQGSILSSHLFVWPTSLPPNSLPGHLASTLGGASYFPFLAPAFSATPGGLVLLLCSLSALILVSRLHTVLADPQFISPSQTSLLNSPLDISTA